MSRQGSPRVNKGTIKTAKRLLGYVTSTYKVQFVVVIFCILISSIASISVSLSLRFLLDDYIIPLIGQQDPDYTELYMALTVLGTIFPVRCDCNVCLQPSDGNDRSGRSEACPR